MFGNLTNFEGSLLDNLGRMQQEVEELFGPFAWPAGIRSVARGTFPPINVGSTNEGVDIYLFAAGLDPKTLDISIQQNLLTVAGERMIETPENVQYYRRERFSGSFRRVISLPEDVNPEKIEASLKDGGLTVRIPKRAEVRPRKIEVRTG
jgi:HSP20 family protein